MKVWTKVVYQWDDRAQAYVTNEAESTWEEYEGPVAECKKGSSAPAPDPAIGQAAKMNIQLGKEWLRFAKEQYAVANERQEGVDALTSKVANQQLADSQLASERGSEQYDRYKRLFQPVEDRFVKEAMEYDTPEAQTAATAP